MPYYYIILICAGALLLLYFACGLALAVYMYCFGRRSNDEVLKHEIKIKKFDVKLLDIPCERFYTHSRFGYRLHARLYRAEKPTNKFLIDLHGKNSSSISQMKYLRIFTELGYNVFIPDHRSCGDSGCISSTFGAYEKYDVMTWMNFLQKNNPDARFAVFGESMGASTAVLVASVDDRIEALVSYCAFSDIIKVVRDLAGKAAPKFFRMFIPAYRVASLLFFGVSPRLNSVERAMAKINIPTLIMHSHGDMLVDVRHAKRLAEINERAETVYFKDARHACSYVYYSDEFSTAVQQFLLKNFPLNDEDKSIK